MVSKGSLLMMAIVLYVGLQMYQIPLPEGCSQPIRLKIFFYVYGWIGRFGSLVAALGITTEARFKNYVLNGACRLLKTHTDGITERDTTFDGVPVRIYTPVGDQKNLPGMIFYHGGGWTVGSPDVYDEFTAMVASEGNMVVVSVDYRLTPDFTKKDGFDDCVKATKYFIKNADTFAVDKSRICVGGDSAGGNYAAAVSLYFRDTKFSPMPKIQLLIYPAVQVLDLQLPSYQQNVKGPFLNRYEMMWFLSHVYAGDTKYRNTFVANQHVPRDVREKMAASVLNTDLLPKEMLYPPYKRPEFEKVNNEVWSKVKENCYEPYHWPLMAEDHSNLPEAYVLTVQYDPLRDDGYFYARKLREAGVKVTHYNCPYGWHGMINLPKQFADSRRVAKDIIAYLDDAL